MLPVGGGHEVHYEDSGNPDGIPTVYLHGGPGGRLSGGYRRNAPADRYRIIGLSQRGTGRSTPSAAAPGYDLAQNTTAHLIADLEVLREHLGVEAWVLQGVSWGSTLALAYAQAHPDRVLGIVLMAVTSTSRREVDWITEDVGDLYPEAWDAFATFAELHGDADRRDRSPRRVRLVEAYRRMLTSGDGDLEARAAQAWMTWEDAHIAIGTPASPMPHAPVDPSPADRAYALGFARLVTHYWAHDGFGPEGGLLSRMDRIGHIPAVLIHGRRDVSGPAVTAWELHRVWPASELVIVEDEGHGGPEMVARWRRAMEELAETLRPGVRIRSARLRELDPATLYRILRLREATFSLEQQATDADLDGRELEDGTWLVWVSAPHGAGDDRSEVPVAHARVLTDPDAMRIGRVVVDAAHRRDGLGRVVMRAALDVCHDLHPEQEVRIDAQAHLERWYAAMGFVSVGQPFLEAGILHVAMTRPPR